MLDLILLLHFCLNIYIFILYLCAFTRRERTGKVQPTVDKSVQNRLSSGNCAKVYILLPNMKSFYGSHMATVNLH